MKVCRTEQNAVRLRHELVEFIDQRVERGEASSRAGVITHALDRQRRHEIAARDAAILAEAGPDPNLDGLSEWAASTSLNNLA